MAAADDDDEGFFFGDFKSATQPNPTVHFTPPRKTMMNGPDFFTTQNNSILDTDDNDDDDDDDWGDFVAGGGLAHSQSLPKTSKPSDLFGSTESTEPIQPVSAPAPAPDPARDKSSHWEKPRGALPLSIFGEAEEEEKEENGSAAGGAAEGPSSDLKKVGDDQKKGGQAVNMSDLIANLYKRSVPENGSMRDFNPLSSDPHGSGLDANANGTKEQDLSSMGLNLGWDPLNLNQNEVNINRNMSSVGLEKKGELSVVNCGVVNGNQNEEEDDDYGWEFVAADDKKDVGDHVAKNDQIKSENGQVSGINTFSSSANVMSWGFNGWNADVNKVNASANGFGVDPAHETTGRGNDDGWEFKVGGSTTMFGDKDPKDGEIKAWNVSNLNFSGRDLSWDGLHPDSNGLSLSVNEVNVNGKQSKLNLVGKDNDFSDADGWGFKGAETGLQVTDGNAKSEPIKIDFNSSWNTLNWDGDGMNSSSKLDGKNINSNLLDENEVFDVDDGWEFKSAQSEYRAGDGNVKGDTGGPQNHGGVIDTFGIGNEAHGFSDLFGASQATSQKSGEWDLGLGLNPSSLTAEDASKGNENEVNSTLHFSSVDEKTDADPNSWPFRDAFSETGSKDKEVPMGTEVYPAVEVFSFDGKTQSNNENQKRALSLSLFGDEQEEGDDPVTSQDISTKIARSNTEDSAKSPSIPINDLISSLYSQAEQNTSTNPALRQNKNEFNFTKTATVSNLENAEDNFDEDSWEFKGASFGTRVEDQSSIPGLGGADAEHSTKIEINEYVDFFMKLEKELHPVVQCHLENLKKARSASDHTGEGAELQALHKELQDLHSELSQDGIISSEALTESHSLRNISIDECCKVLQEPKFQPFDSEYQLSEKLSLVENNLRAAVDLLKYVAKILKVLTLASGEEQVVYVSTWYKMLSVCAEELKHGASIWKQSLEKDVNDQILSRPEGMKYILALGEVYRVVEVIGSSSQLYKPWLLASYADSLGVFNLLSECSTVWVNSGLEEALQSICNQAILEYDGSVKTLLESIKQIHDLDAKTLYNYVFSSKEPICQMSILTAGAVPGMKTVVWNGDYYFLPLANLWANLVSCDPPNLPHVHAR